MRDLFSGIVLVAVLAWYSYMDFRLHERLERIEGRQRSACICTDGRSKVMR